MFNIKHESPINIKNESHQALQANHEAVKEKWWENIVSGRKNK